MPTLSTGSSLFQVGCLNSEVGNGMQRLWEESTPPRLPATTWKYRRLRGHCAAGSGLSVRPPMGETQQNAKVQRLPNCYTSIPIPIATTDVCRSLGSNLLRPWILLWNLWGMPLS